MDDNKEDDGLNLYLGAIVARRWKIVKKLGEGACGYVFRVEEIDTKVLAALKVELDDADTGHVLKLEVQILKRLRGRRHIPQLLHCGKKSRYSYMVMTLLGPSLDRLARPHFSSVSTQVRVAIHILFGLKQLHEVGYVHRDVKPANLAVGMGGLSERVFHLLDFGLSREFVIRSKGTIRMRTPRVDALFRGTSHYCSVSALGSNEQGRVDDLWSMLYLLAEMREVLPWDRLRNKQEIRHMKEETPDEELFYNSPGQFIAIACHLRTLDYYSRPDYLLIFEQFYKVMLELRISHCDPFDWEEDSEPTHRARKTSVPSVGRHGRQGGGKPLASVSAYVPVRGMNTRSAPKQVHLPAKQMQLPVKHSTRAYTPGNLCSLYIPEKKKCAFVSAQKNSSYGRTYGKHHSKGKRPENRLDSNRNVRSSYFPQPTQRTSIGSSMPRRTTSGSRSHDERTTHRTPRSTQSSHTSTEATASERERSSSPLLQPDRGSASEDCLDLYSAASFMTNEIGF